MDEASEAQPEPVQEDEAGPARALTLHLMRMLETRADAAGIALQHEMQAFQHRLQLKVLAGAAAFFAVWAGIVLLAIALPPHLRIPVLAAVVAVFVVAAVAAHLVAKRRVSSRDVGSMSWFLDSLRLDFEVLSRALAHSRAEQQPTPTQQKGEPNDLAA